MIGSSGVLRRLQRAIRVASALIATLVLAMLGPHSSALPAGGQQGAGSVLMANIFEVDDRERHDRVAGTPYGGIVLIVDPTTDKAGTGFLIAPCYVMSALHVVLSEFDLGARRYPSVRYQYTLYYGVGTRFGAFEDFTVARPVAWGGYFAPLTVDPSEDWIVLQLDDCIGDRYGHFQLGARGYASASAFVELSMAGYPRSDDLRTVQVDPACRIMAERRWPGARGPLWYHDCATREGASGAPIYASIDGSYETFAIAVGELQPIEPVQSAYSDRHANVAVPVGNAQWALAALEGESQERVAEVQQMLQGLGRSAGRVDGVPDPGTRQAVQAYRALRRLPETGLITDELVASLRHDVANRSRSVP